MSNDGTSGNQQSSSPIGNIQLPADLGEKLFRLRDYTPIPLIIMMLWLAHPFVLSVTVGLIMVVVGELLRVYAVSFIGGVSRTRTESTGGNVISEGPFAYTRNPLYIGNFLISVGFAVYSGSILVILLTIGLFVFQYHHIVNYEEGLLMARFGTPYDEYMRRVPRWLPSHVPALDDLKWPESFTPAIRSEKRTLTAIALMIVALLITSL